MNNKLLIGLLIIGLCITVVGCGLKTSVKEKAELDEVDGVSMTIKVETLTRTKATIVINDTSGKNYIYGEPFRIDKKENGTWKEAGKIGETDFNLPAYKVDKDNKLELNQDWTHIYGKLPNGEYRLVKDTFLESKVPMAEKDKLYFSVEFTIE